MSTSSNPKDAFSPALLAAVKGSKMVALWLEAATKAVVQAGGVSSPTEGWSMARQAFDGAVAKLQDNGGAYAAPAMQKFITVCGGGDNPTGSISMESPACKGHNRNYTSTEAVNTGQYPAWMQDRRWTVPTFPVKGRLFFIHIPKTGGTAIEDAAARQGYTWGRFDRHYDGVNGDGMPGTNKMCGSPWHEPFHFGRRPGRQQTVCTIREPVDRCVMRTSSLSIRVGRLRLGVVRSGRLAGMCGCDINVC
jgi:hypothetical protein